MRFFSGNCVVLHKSNRDYGEFRWTQWTEESKMAAKNRVYQEALKFLDSHNGKIGKNTVQRTLEHLKRCNVVLHKNVKQMRLNIVEPNYDHRGAVWVRSVTCFLSLCNSYENLHVVNLLSLIVGNIVTYTYMYTVQGWLWYFELEAYYILIVGHSILSTYMCTLQV